MVWQFDGQRGGERRQHWLDEDGRAIDAPAGFPLSAAELAAGFPASTSVLQPAAEAVPGG
jgi:hypothetical protein